MDNPVQRVDFTCQYCSRPLNLDESFNALISGSRLDSSGNSSHYSGRVESPTPKTASSPVSTRPYACTQTPHKLIPIPSLAPATTPATTPTLALRDENSVNENGEEMDVNEEYRNVASVIEGHDATERLNVQSHTLTQTYVKTHKTAGSGIDGETSPTCVVVKSPRGRGCSDKRQQESFVFLSQRLMDMSLGREGTGQGRMDSGAYKGVMGLESTNVERKRLIEGSADGMEANSLENVGRLSVDVLTDLFDFVSGECDVDHPLCTECADQLVHVLQARVDESKEEEAMYRDFVDSHYSDENEIVVQAAKDKEALIEYENEEKELIAQLEAMAEKRATTRAELMKLTAEREELKTEEKRFWKDISEVTRQISDFVQSSAQVQTNHKHVTQTLERLKRTNIYNDAFHIWADGQFGTINGLRMGRTIQIQVPWDEINAAWGQAVLLLETLAKHIGLVFSKYKLCPQGSHSRIEKIENGQHLELWLSSGLQVFRTSYYDQGMVAFLFCLSELSKRIEELDERFKLPYEQKQGQKDKIGGASIKRGLPNTDEKWTKACKYTLTNLKWCLTWICKCVPDTQ
eukprot:CFRG3767T1